MMKSVLLLVTLCAVISYSAADRKRCFCKAVAADNHNNVIHDFGTIEEHRNWLSVGCRRLHGCSSKCDEKVKKWVCDHISECKAKTKGKHVLPYYTASVCGKGAGNNARACECQVTKTNKCQLKCIAEVRGVDFFRFISCLNKCLQTARKTGRIAAVGIAAV